MDMSSVQWLSALGMDDPVLARQCSNISTITGEQLGTMEQLPNKNSNSIGSISSYIPIQNHEIPQMANSRFSLGVRSSESLTGSERPQKIQKMHNYHSNSSQSPFSSVYSANPLQKFEVMDQHSLPQQLESYIKSLPQLKDEIYEAVAPRTPNMQGEIMFSQGSASHENYIFDINNCVDAVGSFGGRELLSTENVFPMTSMKNSVVPAKTSGNSLDHIMAERKRRERLSQRFIALTSIIPGLKKMDKASVLDDTIKYVKKLQERLNVLEQQTTKKTLQSVVYVNKSPSSSRPAKMRSEETFSDPKPFLAPEIEARLVDKSVLIRIHCEKKKGLLVKFLAELEKLQLIVLNASILSFSETTLDLTLSAQVEEGCPLTVTNIVKNLEAVFKKMI